MCLSCQIWSVDDFVSFHCVKNYLLLEIKYGGCLLLGSNFLRRSPMKRDLPSDGIQKFKNRFSFVSNSLTTGSLIFESPFAAVV